MKPSKHHAADAKASGAAAITPPPRVCLSIQEACGSLGVSWDFWKEHVEPEVGVIRLGRRKLVPVRALEEWAVGHASLC